ncbi:protein GRINL1A [Eudromia elegans]
MAELRGRSLPELRDMLRRQQRLLADRRFVSRLPDGGRKVAELAARLGHAVRQEEERAAREAAASVRGSPRTLGESDSEKTPATAQNNLCETSSEPAPSTHLDDEQHLPQDKPQGPEERAGALDSSKDLLAEAFQKVSIVDGDDSGRALEREQNVAKHTGNVFSRTPHYIEVLESRAKNPITKKSKFKTNILSGEQSRSTHGASSSQSPEGSGSPMTPEERRLRDKKHLNDITAARLPPLHHAPAKLLSIEESIAIQIQQKEAYEEMQAKLAAQKLAERLNIKMVRFEPEGEASMQYREVRDEDYVSGED